MTIDFYDAGNGDGLFDILGKIFFAQAAMNTAVGTTVRDELTDILTQVELLNDSLELTNAVSLVTTADLAFASGGLSAQQQLAQVAANLLVEIVNADTLLSSKTIDAAIAEMLRQMEDNSESVDASTVAASVADVGSPAGDGVFIVSVKRGDGRVAELAIAETLQLSTNTPGPSAAIQFLAGAATFNLLDPTWPDGSGVNTLLASIEGDDGLLTNGEFDDESTDYPNVPENWIVLTGTAGTTILMTDVEIQTIAIAGTPTGGYYLLHWTNADGFTQTTEPIPFDADGSTLQSALRELTGLDGIDVTTTGTEPDYTHTITFTTLGGNVSQFTSTNRMTGATSTVNEKQRITITGRPDGGTFTLTYAGQTTAGIDWDATASEVATALVGLSNIDAMTGTGGPMPNATADMEFGGSLASTDVAAMTISTSGLTKTAPSVTVTTTTAGGAGGVNEVQTITADGVPNGGTWTITWSGQTTSAIASTADAYTVRDALCALSNIAGTDEVQTLTITGTPTGGTFTMTYSGQTTAGIAFDANAATVQAALEALSNIGAGDVVCTGGALPGTPVVVTFRKALGRTNVALMTANGASLTGGTSPAAAVSLTTAGVDSEVTVTGGTLGVDAFVVTFVNGLGSANQPAMTVDNSSLLGPDVTVSIATLTPGSAAQSEVQQFALYGTPTGGTFTLTLDSVTSGAIAYNASNATIDTAIEAMSNVGSGNITISGGTLPGTAVNVTFGGSLANTTISQMVINGASLTGGSIFATMSTPTPGVPGLSTNNTAYWKMDEASGTRYDAVGGFDLTQQVATVGSVTGKIANAASFVSGGYLENYNETLADATRDFTIAGWVQLTNSSAACEIFSAYADTLPTFQLIFNGTRFEFDVISQTPGGSGQVIANTFGAPSAGVWYFLAASFNAATKELSLSVNGGTADTDTMTGVLTGNGTTGTNRVLFGALFGFTRTFYADELGIWDDVLDSSKITALYNSGTGLTTPFTSGTNEVQQIAISGSPSQGSFTLTYGGETTVAIAYNANAAAVQSALEGLSVIDVGDVSCTGGALPGTPVLIEFTGDLAATDVAQMTVNDNGLKTSITTTTQGNAGTNEVQRISASPVPVAGTFTLTYSGQTTSALDFDATASEIDAALEALSNIGAGDVTVTGGPINSANVTVTFTNALAATNVDQMTATSSLTGASPTELTVATTTEGVSPSNETQSFTLGPDVTGGTYTLTWHNGTSSQTTGAIAWNADAATVRTALEATSTIAPGDVATGGGPSPAAVTVTFQGAYAGLNVNAMTGSGASLTQDAIAGTITTIQDGSPDSGSITHLTTSAGTPQVYSGAKALILASNGSELTTLQQRITGLQGATPYSVHLWACADSVPAAGVLKVELIDGTNGTVLADDQGVANVLTFNASSLTTSWKSLTELVSGECVFRLPTNVPSIVYLRLRISTAVTSGRQIFLDRMTMAAMSELYAGGPWVSIIGGAAPFVVGDRFTMTVTNDRAGVVQEWFGRNFNMAQLGLLLPSNSAGSETIPDSVVS